MTSGALLVYFKYSVRWATNKKTDDLCACSHFFTTAIVTSAFHLGTYSDDLFCGDGGTFQAEFGVVATGNCLSHNNNNNF